MTVNRRMDSPLSSWLRNNALAASIIILLCSGSVRLVMTLRADPVEMVALYPDSSTYLVPAENVIAHGAFLDSHGKPMVDRTPGYPALLALIMLLTGNNLRAVLVVQACIVSFTVLLVYLLARRTLPPAVAFVGAVLAAFSPWGAVLAGIPMSDGVFVLLLALIFLGMKLIDEAGYTRWVYFGAVVVGLLTGVAVLVRPLVPLVLLVPAGMFFCCRTKRRTAWLMSAVTLLCALAPVILWTMRNEREAHFNSVSDIPGKTAWRYLAARVNAEVDGQDRYLASAAAYEDDSHWALSVQEADNEHWRRADAVFRKHPILTAYSFVRSAAEHTFNPSPDVLTPSKLNFHGDSLLLAALWGGLLIFAAVGSLWAPGPEWEDGRINRRWLLTFLAICSVLTLTSGVSFGAGARLRAPLELIVPLLAAVGLMHLVAAWLESRDKKEMIRALRTSRGPDRIAGEVASRKRI